MFLILIGIIIPVTLLEAHTSGKSGKLSGPGQPDILFNPGKHGKPGFFIRTAIQRRPGSPIHSGAQGRPRSPVHPGKPVKPGKPDKPGKPVKPGKPGNPGKFSHSMDSQHITQMFSFFVK